MANYTGQHFGPYRLLRLLGQNDGTWVYLGEHLVLHTQVVIKVLTLRLTSDEVRQFRTQTATLTRLTHPSLLQVLDSGVQGGLSFLVMDYAPGGSLRKHHPRGTILDPAIVLEASYSPFHVTVYSYSSLSSAHTRDLLGMVDARQGGDGSVGGSSPLLCSCDAHPASRPSFLLIPG